MPWIPAAIIGGSTIASALIGRRGGASSEDKERLEGLSTNVSNVAEKELLPFAKDVKDTTWPMMKDYTKWLTDLTSADPSTRFAAVAPQAMDISAQTEGAKRQIANLPRGGEQNYLMASAEMGEAGSIGRLLTELYTRAQEAKGQVGEWGAQTFLSALSEYGGLEGIAAQIETAKWDRSAQGTQALMNSLQSIAQMIASSVGKRGGGDSETPGMVAPTSTSEPWKES